MPFDEVQFQASLDFLISNLLNDALALGLSDKFGGEVVHVNSSLPHEFNLSIANNLTVDVEIDRLPTPPSPSNYHFHIQFVNNECFFNSTSLTLITPDWAMTAIPSEGFVTDIYLVYTKDKIVLKPTHAPDQVLYIKLTYTEATLSTPDVEVLQVAVTVGQNVSAMNPKRPVTGTETIHLTTFTDASAPSPLIATLVQPRTVLNDNTDSELLLRLVNTSPEPLEFAAPPRKGELTPTVIQLSVDVDSAAAWALCKSDEAKLLRIDPPATNWLGDPKGVPGTGQKTWVFRPDYSKLKQIPANSAIEFHISGLKTTLPPGFTNLYVALKEFPNYGTQTLVTQIEKSPLIYNRGLNSGLLTQGTTGGNQALAVHGNTTGDMLLVDQTGSGASAHFKGGKGVNLENGLAVLAGTNKQRRLMSVQGGMAVGSTFADKDVPTANSLIVEGVLGVGTDTPKSTVSVQGGLSVGTKYAGANNATAGQVLVEGVIGIGTPTPKSLLAVQGGAAVGASYAGTIAAPANTLLVEGAIGIGTPTPKSALAVKGGATVGSLYINTPAPAEGLLVQGNVGIGTDTPKSKLSLAGNLAIGSYANTTAAPENGLIVEGNVGIGTANPMRGKLEIVGWQKTDVESFSFLAYRKEMAHPFVDNAPPTRIYSGLYCEQRIVGLEFDSVSDARIKSVIGRSDGAADLATLMQIEVTDYTYKDKVGRDPRPKKKVIGQQLREVFEPAVSQTREIVPDIYQEATSSDGWIALETTLERGDRVRVIPEKEGSSEVEVTEVESNRFRVSPPVPDGPVFVYGREVADFMHVDYDALSMLNVSATQQLKREKDNEIQSLREENAALRGRLDQLEALIKKLT